MLNLESKTSYYCVDEHGMVWVPSDKSWEKRSWWKKLWDKILKREWIPSWTNKSKRDSIGRTVLAGLAYGFTSEMIKGLENCYRDGLLYRHPESDEVASRDHHSYFFIYRKHSEWELPYFPRMRGMNLWMGTLLCNKKAEKKYYRRAILSAYIGNAWLRFCRLAGRIRPERENSKWVLTPIWEIRQDGEVIYSGECGWTHGEETQRNRTKWQNLWSRIIVGTIPAFALHIKAWQLYVMPEHNKRKKLQQILLKRVGKSNILVRLLLGDTTVSEKDVSQYPDMTGYRPGVYLDESCRRDIREMTPEEAEFNNYEKELIIWLYGQNLLTENGSKLLKENNGTIKL